MPRPTQDPQPSFIRMFTIYKQIFLGAGTSSIKENKQQHGMVSDFPMFPEL